MEDEMRHWHLTETKLGDWKIGLCEGPAHERRIYPDPGTEVIVAPREWVDGICHAEGVEMADEAMREVIEAWHRWLVDPETAAAVYDDEGGRATLARRLWSEHGLVGQDASVCTEATIDAVARARIAAMA